MAEQALRGQTPRIEQVTGKVAREHEAIVSALQMLEKALAAPAPSRETVWNRRAGAALVIVVDSLNVHRESAENKGGLLSEAELVLGQPRGLAVARSQHARLLKDANGLLAFLEERPSDPTITYRGVRQRAWRLASALRSHQALEADLIVEAFGRDIGGEG
jgi:hypothetical protein